MKQIIFSMAIIGLVFGSLITFPAYLHWMLLIWLGLAVIQNYKNRAIWPWLVGMIVILALKRTGYGLEFWVLVCSTLLVAVFDWRNRTKKDSSSKRKSYWIYTILILASFGAFTTVRWLDSNTAIHQVLDTRPIACLGDSLTDYGYPQELEKMIRVPVADFGLDGITTDDGIKMIPDILATNPQMVVLELGGHDYNADKKPRDQTKKNLALLIEAFLNRNIGVILIEIPRGFITDPYGGIERELSAQYDLQLIDDSLIRSFIFNSPILPPGIWLDPSQRYSDDGLHPNALGNKYFAERVSQALSRVFGKQILKQKKYAADE